MLIPTTISANYSQDDNAYQVK